jgi:hypothetical protein
MQASIDDVVSNERGIAKAELSPILYDCAMRAPEFPIYEGKVELNPNAIGKIVADEDLRYGTIDVLVNGVWNFAAILLQSAEMGELLGEAAEKAGVIDALGLCRGVNGAEVASKCWLDASGCQNGWEQNFHTEQSVKLIKEAKLLDCDA